MGRKRKFIDSKKEKVHVFKVVHRSQQDPLIADEDAPQHVLAEIKPAKKNRNKLADEYGIYVDENDDYDYLQHIKDPNDVKGCDMEEIITVKHEPKNNFGKLKIHPSLLPSVEEDAVGMLNKGVDLNGPQVELDPDIVAELDKAEGEEREEMEDDFIALLNGESAPDAMEEEVSENAQYDGVNFEKFMYGFRAPKDAELSDDTDFDDYDNGEEWITDNEEDDDLDLLSRTSRTPLPKSSRSQISQYTVTTNRSEQLKMLDAKFEAVMRREYDGGNSRCMEPPNSDGPRLENSEYLQELAKPKSTVNREQQEKDERAQAIAWIKGRIAENDGDPDLPDEYETIKVTVKPPTREDLESEIPRSKNKRNYAPTVISLPYSKKRKLTKNAVDKHNQEEDTSNLTDMNEETRTMYTLTSQRQRGESTVMKQERKATLKAIRRLRRVEKKENKLLQKEHNKKMEELRMNRKNTPKVRFL